jgi:CDP-glucose 4,6-dehydratase
VYAVFVSQILRKLPGPVLITGHTGFKGTWLTLLLEKMGIEVLGYSLEAEPNSLFERLQRKGILHEKIGDVRVYSDLYKFVNESKPSVIFHLAAQSLVIPSYEDPINTFSTNIMGTANLLEIARNVHSVQATMVVTSDKVYLNNNSGKKFVESDVLGGVDPYSASKACAELAVSAWQNLSVQESGMPIVSLRAGNVIGGGDVARNRLLPDLVRKFEYQDNIIFRNPNSTRPWQHVLDPLHGYILAAEEALSAQTKTPAFNFAPSETPMTVNQVINVFQEYWSTHESAEITYQEMLNEKKYYEAQNLNLDASLARKQLNWIPKWSQKEAVRDTAMWWKSVLRELVSPEEACHADISKII